MIGLDTNVVIRYLVQDDPHQAALASQLIETTLSAENPGYLNHITLCEITWVLQRCYGVGREQLVQILTGLLTTKQLVVENVEVAWKALRSYDGGGADFCDALIARSNTFAGCRHTATFDQGAARLPGFVLLRESGL